MLMAALRDMQWRRRRFDIFGAPERGPGMPAVSEGRVPSTPNEVAVSSTLGRSVGDVDGPAPDTVRLKAGEVLFEQGTMGDLIYVISEGELEIVRELESGAEELLKVAKAGDYFGEIGPVFHLPRSATVRACTDATLVGYTVRMFRERLGVGGVRDLIEHRPLPSD
jgi:hypothetical protein